MTHYKKDEELAEHIRDDSGYQSFNTTSVTTKDGGGNSHTESAHHEVIRSSTSPPLTGHSSSGSSHSEHHTSFTHTEAKGPLITTTHPVVLSSATGLAHDIVDNQAGIMASAMHVTSGEHSHDVYETPELREQRLKDEAKYREKQDEIARKHDKHLEKVTDEYRKKTEHEAEKIRKELEKQYKRDIDYRKEVVNESVKRQKQELELEVKYAKKELEHERQLARDALDHSKMQTDVQVNLETSAGHTVSGGSHIEEEHLEHKKSLASKIKDTLTGH